MSAAAALAQAPPGGAPPIILVIETARRGVTCQTLALIVLFIAVVAFAAYATGRAASTPLKREAAEASLVAQAAVPLAMTAALV